MPTKNAQLDWQLTTPINKQFNDPYFSLADGLAETDYVFLRHNLLPERWQNKSEYVIAETGFGTGLNFLVTAAKWFETTADNADNSARLTYYSVEKYPLSVIDLAKSFENWPQFKMISSTILQNYPDGLPGFHTINIHVSDATIQLVLMIGDVLPMLNNMQCDVDSWYLDGFSPAKNPAMWTLAVCQRIAELSHSETRFATFTAAGEVRRNLQSVGFDVKKNPGFGKKREMLSGVYSGEKKQKKSNKPWFNISKNIIDQPNGDRVIIVGGGLAGLSCAWMLSRQNRASIVIEAGEGLASGASGNAAGIVLPRINLDVNLEAQFYISSFLFAISWLNELKKQNDKLIWRQTGVLQLASLERMEKISNLALPESFIQCLTQQQASEKANIGLSRGGWFFPAAGYVEPNQLCETLAKASREYLSIKTKTTIHRLEREIDYWHLYDEKNQLISQAKTIIFANGFDAQRLLSLKSLNLTKNRGQLTYLPTQAGIKNLKLPICADTYLVPAINGMHVVGATYDKNNEDLSLSMADNAQNLQGIEKILNARLSVKSEALLGRASFRTTSLDHLPLVGAVPNEEDYRLDYVDVCHGRKPETFPAATYLPGLFISTGHGSRGLVSCFSSAAHITSLIDNGPITWAEDICHLLHPARFLIRSMKRR